MVFNTLLYDFIGIIQQFLEILVIFGGYWALFEVRSWGEVGRWLPISYLYKLGLLEAMAGDSNQIYDEGKPSQSHFYAGKLLRNAPLQAISGSSSHPF